MKRIIVLLRSFAVALLALGFAAGAFAQSYPSKPVRMIVPFGAGGPADLLGRHIAQKLQDAWGNPVVVENRPGGNNVPAALALIQSDPDGHTLLLAIDWIWTINPHMFSKSPFDPFKDFAPTGMVAMVQAFIAVNPSVPANSIRELVAMAKAKPDTVTFSMSGVGGGLGKELFDRLGGVKTRGINYKGDIESITALQAGEIQASLVAASTGLALHKAGKIKILAAATSERNPLAPEIPTVAESGVPGYEFATAQTIVVPAATPRAVINKINGDVSRIMKLPESFERLKPFGIIPMSTTPEEQTAWMRTTSEKWGKIIKDLGLKFE